MEVVIEKLGHRGDGIAEGPIYAARTLPGEVVAGDVHNGRIREPRILQSSPERVAPPCPHYRSCGGCALQHASDGFVERWKVEVVRQALSAQGIEAVVAGIATSPSHSRRRAVLSGRRTRGGALVGFHARASETLVAIPDCRLLHPRIMAILPALEALTMRGATRKSEIVLTVIESAAGCDVAVTEARDADADLRADLAGLAERHGLARLSWNGEIIAQVAVPQRHFDGVPVVPPPGAFLQATDHGESALLAVVLDTVGDARRVVDLFAGSGTFALPMARKAQVHAVEGESAPLASLALAARQAKGLREMTTERRDLFRRPLTNDDLAQFDAAVIDPPRAGAEAQTRELARSRVQRIAAVSCNPATFARDARQLVDAGYRIGPVRVVDQFRWSTHAEMVAGFLRKG